VTWLWHGMEDF